jgi:protein TonB
MKDEQGAAAREAYDPIAEDRSWPADDLPKTRDHVAVRETLEACRDCPRCGCVNFGDALACRECQGRLETGEPGLTLAEPAEMDVPEADREPPIPLAALGPAQVCPACGAQDGPGASLPGDFAAPLRGPAPVRGRSRAAAGALGAWALLATAALGYLIATRPAPTIAPSPPTVLERSAPAAAALAGAPIATLQQPARPDPAPARVMVKAPPRLQSPLPRAPAEPVRAPAPPTRIQDPVWVSAPTEDDLADLYPAGGPPDGGEATLDCAIAEDGGLERCAVVSEYPAGSGFGRAALRLSRYFQADRASASGWPTAGHRVSVPVRWPSE